MDIHLKGLKNQTVNLVSGISNTIFCKTHSSAKRLEMSDVNFHHDSAVVMPERDDAENNDTDYSGLKALAVCFIHANENVDQRLMIVGHTDKSGPEQYNQALSLKRADGIFYVLTGNRDRWVNCSMNKHKVEDYQYILKWLTENRNWNCDPGDVDDINGEQTRAAVKRFQEQYTTTYGTSILHDGVVGKQTWGAIFDIYMEILAELLGIEPEEFASRQSMFSFTQPATFGCGESFPKSTGSSENSIEDRRVELLFFDSGEEPDPADGPLCEQLYGTSYYSYEPIDCPPDKLHDSDAVSLKDEADVSCDLTEVICKTDDGAEIKVRTDGLGTIRLWGKKIDSITIEDVHTLDTL
jgi:hypothetical protein